MTIHRSHNLEIQDTNQQDDLITIKKKAKKKGKKRPRSNENQGVGRKSQRSSRPETEPSVTQKSGNRNVFGTGSMDSKKD
jgi:hypothetical protein